VLADPQTRAAVPSLDDRSGEVRVAPGVGRDAVAMSKAKHLSYLGRVHEVLGVDGRRHDLSLRLLTVGVR
jgi:hypothetical protein